MKELKPCPFCGCHLERRTDLRTFGYADLIRGAAIFFHPYTDCFLDGFTLNINDIKQWNRRTNNGTDKTTD